MTKINIPYTTIRLLTLLSYCLPFMFYLSTCTDDLGGKDAYNKGEAITNERYLNKQKQKEIMSRIHVLDTANIDREKALTDLMGVVEENYYSNDNINNLNRDISEIIYFPTNYSLSAIGSLFLNKSMLGKIVVGISLFISLISFLFWFFIAKKKLGIYFITANLVAMLLFIFDCCFQNITVLCGAYVVLFLLGIQLLTELQYRKKESTA